MTNFVSPSENQRKNLSQMTTILSANRKATILAESLWEFYNYQLYCTVRSDDGAPNRYRIHGVTDRETVETIRVSISIRRNQRQEEGLVHELLHANMIPLGYPKFWIYRDGDQKKWALAGGIINLADHITMFPIYSSLGYSSDRFLGATGPLNQQEGQVAAYLHDHESRLTNPQDYLNCVSEYLDANKIQFKPLYLADAIIAQRISN